MEVNFEDYHHEIEMNVRFMDLDALNHVNNARYLNFLEEARLSYSQQSLEDDDEHRQTNDFLA